MSEYEDKQLKFLQNNPYDVTLDANEPETGQNEHGNIWRKYKIKERTFRCAKKDISGKEIPGGEDKVCDFFFATDKLHEKIQEGNFGEGYKLKITKVYDTEIFKYAFFKVEPQGDGSNIESASIDTLAKDVASSMDMSKAGESKELSLEERVSYIEDKIKTLCAERQKEAGRKTAESKENPYSEDDLPF